MTLGVNATPQFIGSLTELVWAQIGMSDLFPSFMLSRAGLPSLSYGLYFTLLFVAYGCPHYSY